jgi:hypothetical protein
LTVKVILDSNFLFIPSEFRLDIFEELESLLGQNVDLILLSVTYQEIRRLSEEGSPKTRRQASLALELVERCCVVQVERGLEETCDDVIVRVAREWKSPVATNDRALRRRLRSEGVPVVFLRQRHRLELEGAL